MTEFVYHPFPKYLQIREIIRRRLRLLQPGDRLPTEAELAEEFGVSRVTLRQVMQVFAAEGVILRRPKLGTVLQAIPAPPIDNRLTGPIEDFGIAGIETRIAGLTKGETEATAEIAAALLVAEGSKVYAVRRGRIFEDAPLVVPESFFPLKIGRKIAARNMPGLFVPALRKQVDENIWEGQQEIDAMVADAEFAVSLQIAQGAPILCIKRLFLDSAGTPVVFFKEYFRADRYYYTVRLPQPKPARG